MILKVFSSVIVLILITGAGVIAGDPTVARKVWEVSIPWSFAEKPGPKFEHGRFLARDVVPPLIQVYDSSTTLLLDRQFALPSAGQATVSDVAVSPSGTLVVAGAAWNVEGQIARFIAWLNKAGTVEKVVRITPYSARLICVAGDQSVWIAGSESDANLMRRTPNHSVLRRYDAEGRLTHSLLPSSSFPPSRHRHPTEPPSRLVCSADRVGFYSMPANEWIEVSLDGTLLGRWSGPAVHEGTKTTSISMTSAGAVYATTVYRAAGSRAIQPSLLRLDRNTGQWIPVFLGDIPGGNPESNYLEIIGTDGPNLVLNAGLPRIVGARIE